MKSNTDKNKYSKIERAIIVGLLFLITVNVINRIFSSPFDFDEGVGLVLSKFIFLTGKYQTFESAFDYIVTVGPTVYFPAALTFIFGNVFLPRIVIFIYSLLLIYIVTSQFLKKNISRILFLGLLCLTPYYYYFSAHVLGEIPAIFFSLTGLIFLYHKKYFVSGTFLALSIITKNIFLLSLAPALYLLYIQKRDISLKKILSFIAPFLLIGAIWEVYKLHTFQFLFEKYRENLFLFIKHNRSISQPHPEYLPERLSMLSGTFGINGVVFLFFMVSVSVYSFIKNNSHLIRSVALLTLVYLGYYFLLGPTYWYRHLFPSIVIFVIVLADLIPVIRLSRRSTFLFIFIFCLGLIFSQSTSNYIYQQNLLPLFDQTGDRFLDKSDILNQQLKTASYISSNLRDEKISGVVWYNAPEISYLSGKQIFRSPEEPDVSYLISHPFGRLLVPSVDARITEYPLKQIVSDTPLYKIYQKND